MAAMTIQERTRKYALMPVQERKRLWMDLAQYSDGLLSEAKSMNYPPRHRFEHPQQMTILFETLGMRPPRNLRALTKLWTDTEAARRPVSLPQLFQECVALKNSYTALLEQISDAQELKLRTLIAANGEIETLRRALAGKAEIGSRDNVCPMGLGANARSIRYNSWDLRFDAQINKCLVFGFLREAYESMGAAMPPKDIAQICFVWYYDPVCDDNLSELQEVAEKLEDEVEILQEEVQRVHRSKVDLAISTAHEMDALRGQLRDKMVF